MEFKRSTTSGRVKVEYDVDDDGEGYNLSFYEELPVESLTVSLKDFEEYAVARLKLLRIIERVNFTSTVRYSDEWAAAILKEIIKQKLHHFEPLCNIKNKLSPRTQEDPPELRAARRYDHTSHYILRLAFCKNEDLRRWFLHLEIEFFRLKYYYTHPSALVGFLEKHQFPFSPIGSIEKEALFNNLVTGTFGSKVEGVDFYKVPFLSALELVRTRKVFLKNGFCFVPFNELPTVLCSLFRSRLSLDLVATNKLMPMLEEDERLTNILNDFDKRYTGGDYVAKGKGGVSVEQLPNLSKKSFPLCMRKLYEVVTTEHHLKHWGRLQLGLFFKGIGVSLEESVRFWRTEFTKFPGLDAGRFDKQYLYNIRYNYGKEGKRADYTPYTCMKIIMQNVGAGEHHGCPFRNFDKVNLRAKLSEAEISNKEIKEITDLVEKQHFQIACTKYFEYTHNKATIEGGVSHPNQYFEESQKVLAGDFKIKKEVGEKSQGIRANIYSSGSDKPINKKEDLTVSFDQKPGGKVIDKAWGDALDDKDLELLLLSDDFEQEQTQEDMDVDEPPIIPLVNGHGGHKEVEKMVVEEEKVKEIVQNGSGDHQNPAENQNPSVNGTKKDHKEGENDSKMVVEEEKEKEIVQNPTENQNPSVNGTKKDHKEVEIDSKMVVEEEKEREIVQNPTENQNPSVNGNKEDHKEAENDSKMVVEEENEIVQNDHSNPTENQNPSVNENDDHKNDLENDSKMVVEEKKEIVQNGDHSNPPEENEDKETVPAIE